MTATLLTPDVRRIIAELERRLGVLERRINPVAAAPVASGGSDVHDGAGAGSTVVPIDESGSTNSPTATGTQTVSIGGYATAAGDEATVVGYAAEGSGASVVAAGVEAAAQATDAIAVGHGAVANAASATAVGPFSFAQHSAAVALGSGVATTGTSQVNIGTKRAFLGTPNSAPADALLINGQVSVWVDESGNLLTFKVKYSSGTVKSGTVALV